MTVKKVNIPIKHRNKKFVMIATGPSLQPDVIETIRKYKDDHVIFGVNDSYRVVDFLNEFYSCDGKWWQIHGNTLRAKYPYLTCWSQDVLAKPWNVNVVNGVHAPGFSLRHNLIHFGSNSGYQALNIAFLMGGKKFILVGYNMQRVQGLTHFFGDHVGMSNNSPYDRFVINYRTIQKEVRNLVVNCTPNSALTAFRTGILEEELQKDD